DQQDQTYRDLISNRRQLSELIESKHARTIRRTRAFFYMHANKGGKLLVRMLRGAQSRAQVHALRTTQGTLTQFPEEIASEFQRFYTQLYNTRGDEDRISRTTRKTDTTDYLVGFQPDTLTPEEAEELDTPITEEELKQALK
ncbi:endonuclease reverse transcriptase, partial [Pelobates cultripes]